MRCAPQLLGRYFPRCNRGSGGAGVTRSPEWSGRPRHRAPELTALVMRPRERNTLDRSAFRDGHLGSWSRWRSSTLDVHRLPDALHLPSYPIPLLVLVIDELTNAQWSSLVRAVFEKPLGWLGWSAVLRATFATSSLAASSLGC